MNALKSLFVSSNHVTLNKLFNTNEPVIVKNLDHTWDSIFQQFYQGKLSKWLAAVILTSVASIAIITVSKRFEFFTSSNRVGKLRKCSSKLKGHVWAIDFRSLYDSHPNFGPLNFSTYNSIDEEYEYRLILGSSTNKGYLSVSVILASKSYPYFITPVDARIWLSVVNSDNYLVNKQLSMKYCFTNNVSSVVFPKFIPISKVLDRNNKLIFDGLFRIHSFVTITAKHKISTKECKILGPSVEEGILKKSMDMEELLKNQRFSDLTLVSSDAIEFRAHRAVLAARSAYFEAIFSNPMREQDENRFVLEDLSGEILKDVLVYIYAGRVRDFESRVRELLIAADKYLVEDLKGFCQVHLCRQVELDNFREMLIFADTYSADILERKVMDFFVQNSKDVANARDFERLKNSHPKLVAKLFRKMASHQRRQHYG